MKGNNFLEKSDPPRAEEPLIMIYTYCRTLDKHMGLLCYCEQKYPAAQCTTSHGIYYFNLKTQMEPAQSRVHFLH